MPEQDEKDGKNCYGTGINDSPADKPFYLGKTLGLPVLHKKTPEQLAEEKAKNLPREGNWSLAYLRERMTAREAAQQKPSTLKSNASKLKNLAKKMLILGKFLCERTKLKKAPTNMEWLQLRVDLDECSQVGDEILWKAFLGVTPLEQKILSFDYLLGYPAITKRNKPIYSSYELSRAVGKLKVNISSILTYLETKEEEQKGNFSVPRIPPDRSPSEWKNAAVKTELCSSLWLETFPLFSGKPVRFQDFMAADCSFPKGKNLNAKRSGRSLFSWIDWKATGLPLFKNLNEILATAMSRTPPDPRNVLPTALPLKSNRLLVEFRDDNILILDPELARAVQLKWEGKLKKNDIPPKIAGVIRYLNSSEMTMLMMLGIKKRKMGTNPHLRNT